MSLIAQSLYSRHNPLRTSAISQNLHQLIFSLGWFQVEEILIEPFLQHPLEGFNEIHFLTVFIVDPLNIHFGSHSLDMLILNICDTNVPTELLKSVLPPQVGQASLVVIMESRNGGWSSWRKVIYRKFKRFILFLTFCCTFLLMFTTEVFDHPKFLFEILNTKH